MALASSGGYSAERSSAASALGMMIEALGTREASLGRSSLDFLGRSCSDSEPEEEAEKVGEAVPAALTGIGCGGVAVVEAPKDSITPAEGDRRG